MKLIAALLRCFTDLWCVKCGGKGHMSKDCKFGKPKARSAWWR